MQEKLENLSRKSLILVFKDFYIIANEPAI